MVLTCNFPEDLEYTIIGLLSFNDLMKSWRRINVECHNMISNLQKFNPLTTFNHLHGHVSLLPSLKLVDYIIYKQYKRVVKWDIVKYEPKHSSQWFKFWYHNIKSIDLSHNLFSSTLTDIGLFYFIECNILHIRHLNISNCKNLTRASSAYIHEYLKNGLCELTASNVASISDALGVLNAIGEKDTIYPQLTCLNLSNNPTLTWDVVSKFLVHCPNITHLNLYGCKVQDTKFCTLECSSRIINLFVNLQIRTTDLKDILQSCTHIQFLNNQIPFPSLREYCV